jgi:hypothetical protein
VSTSVVESPAFGLMMNLRCTICGNRWQGYENSRCLQCDLTPAGDFTRSSPNGVEPTTLAERVRSRLHIGRAVRSIPAPTPLVDGLLFTPGLSFVYAAPKVGKSFFELDLALCVATGWPFMGREVRQGGALYVVAEGQGGIGERVGAWCEARNTDDIDAAAFLTMAINLSIEMEFAQLEALVAERKPALVVIDTLARCALGAEENSAKDMGIVVGALDRLRDAADCHVSVVHHAGKDQARGLRGTTALRGAADTVISLTGDARAIEIRVEDQKDAEPAPPWWCRLQPVASSVVIVPISGVDRLAPSLVATLDALHRLAAEDRTASRWAEMAESAGVSRRSFFEAKKLLLGRKDVLGGGKRGALYTFPEDDDGGADVLHLRGRGRDGSDA